MWRGEKRSGPEWREAVQQVTKRHHICQHDAQLDDAQQHDDEQHDERHEPTVARRGRKRTAQVAEVCEESRSGERRFRNLGDWYEQAMADDGMAQEGDMDDDGGGRLQPGDGVQGRVGVG